MSLRKGRRSALLSACMLSGLTGWSHAALAQDATTTNTGADQSIIHLEPVKVQGQAKLPATDSSSVSRQQLQNQPATTAADVLIGLPGVYSQTDGMPGLAISVRGMQDFGRVAVSIDGARQDFQVSGHGANGTVFIDPALLAGVDVTRGAVTGAGGSGAIGGTVNLRTIDFQDLVKPGQKEGFEATMMGGTNGYNGSGMVAGAAQLNQYVNVVGAFSLRSSGDYSDGNGNKVPESAQKLQSGLVKMNIQLSPSQTLQLGDVFYHNNFGMETEGVTSHDSVNTNTFTAKYHLAPADNELVDLHVNGAYTRTVLNDATDSFIGTSVAPADRTHYTLDTLSLQADNLSRFALGPVATSIDYGFEYYHDQVKTTDLTGNTGETPKGVRQLGGLFTEAHFGWNIFELTTGARVDHYNLSGSGYNQTAGITSQPVGYYNTHKSATGFSPKATLAVNPLPGLQFYGSYGLGFRPPSVTETLFNGAHPGVTFVRFVPNPNLTPERTHGWELGTKLAYNDVLAHGDTFNFSGDYFYTKIRDYIDENYLINGTQPSAYGPMPIYGYYYQNTPGITVSQGFELEANYDSSYAFAHVAYSNTSTKLPEPNANHYSQIPTTPPRDVFSGTLGIKLLQSKLIIGERTRAASSSYTQSTRPSLVDGYVVEDLFANYKLTPNITLFASADNITNNNYSTDALASVNSPGRTVKFGLTVALGR